MSKITMPHLFSALAIGSNLALLFVSPVNVANILYLNSTRGRGTGNLGNFRSVIADTLDNYQNGSVFDVDFVQTHIAGDGASFLNAKPIWIN
ncbi:MAG: hypothetical protein HRT59_26025 [Crocosphaera sp.]|nr:hypothetical protein [Crocosphaera sp.]